MTRDRDFKDLVRTRAAKTGESYQAARRQLTGPESAADTDTDAVVRVRVRAIFRTQDPPGGLAYGCVVETGRLERGMRVALSIGDTEVHRGVVASLRRAKDDIDAVAAGDGPFGLMVDPPYEGPIPHFVTG